MNRIITLLFTIVIITISQKSMGQMPKIKKIEIDDCQVAYYEQGKGETIILLHGWPQTSYVWRKIFPKLAEKYRVIAIDLPGLGKSEETTNYDTKSIATIIDDFTNKLNIKKFNLIGHDVGSWVAVSYAINFENKLKTLTIIDAGIPGLMSPQVFQPENTNKIWQFYFHSIDEIPEMLTDGKEKEYLSWYFTKKSFVKDAIKPQDLAEYYHDYKGKQRMKNGFDYYRAFDKSGKQNQNFNDKLIIPVMAIGGKMAMAEQVGFAMNKIAENVKSKTIENCGHYVPEEQPELLTEIIEKFIN